jgi:hypothetical protein
MSNWHWLPVVFAALMLSGAHPAADAQPLAVNPSAAASDVRNPSSTNPSARASDIRNPSATNPSAAASQIPQPASGIAPRRTNLTPALVDERVRVPPRRARKAQAPEPRTEPRRAAAADQMTRPFEALEAARRDRIEMEKRIAQEKANEARAAREQKAKERAEAKRGAAQKPESEFGGNTPTAPTKSN